MVYLYLFVDFESVPHITTIPTLGETSHETTQITARGFQHIPTARGMPKSCSFQTVETCWNQAEKVAIIRQRHIVKTCIARLRNDPSAILRLLPLAETNQSQIRWLEHQGFEDISDGKFVRQLTLWDSRLHSRPKCNLETIRNPKHELENKIPIRYVLFILFPGVFSRRFPVGIPKISAMTRSPPNLQCKYRDFLIAPICMLHMDTLWLVRCGNVEQRHKGQENMRAWKCGSSYRCRARRSIPTSGVS